MAIELTDDGAKFHNPDGYTVNEHGIIQDPGKFEAEPIYVPYFWNVVLDGIAEDVDDDGQTLSVIMIDDEDRAKFPQLLDAGDYAIVLSERESGFVDSEVLTQTEYEAWREKIDNRPPSEPQEDDITTTDHETFYQYGQPIISNARKRNDLDLSETWYFQIDGKQFKVEAEDYRAALRAYMDRTQFWPNAWFISDHGNAHLIDLSEGGK